MIQNSRSNFRADQRSGNQQQAKQGAEWRPILSLRAYLAWKIGPAKFQCCVKCFLDLVSSNDHLWVENRGITLRLFLLSWATIVHSVPKYAKISYFAKNMSENLGYCGPPLSDGPLLPSFLVLPSFFFLGKFWRSVLEWGEVKVVWL